MAIEIKKFHMALRGYDLCKEIPKQLTADDGRVFRIRLWRPEASVSSVANVTCELIPDFSSGSNKDKGDTNE